MIKKQLYELVIQEQYIDALSLITSTTISSKDIDSEFCILCATVCQNLNLQDEMFMWIQTGLRLEYNNYELYLLLGTYYENTNANQAYLCYENALFYCNNSDDITVIKNYISNLLSNFHIDVTKTSIVILSYNTLDMTRQCIESIQRTTPESCYELIVIDNCSSDGSIEYLKSLNNITLVCNENNVGFPKGCNQGISLSAPSNDIFLLNNDTIVMPNSIFWLRMGLYENSEIGSVGSITNCAINGQQVFEHFNTISEYTAYALATNIPSQNPYEYKTWLVGYALLIRRSALLKTGLLDEEFSPGCFEDNDIGVRLQLAGFKSCLVHNSFIFHYGNGGGNNSDLWISVKNKNAKYFQNKWGFDLTAYSSPRFDVIQLINNKSDDSISVLDIECGYGSTLSAIKYKWPNSSVHGIEKFEKIAELGEKNFNIIHHNIEDENLPYNTQQFDYILLCDVLEYLHNPQKTLLYLKIFLKENGKILCSIPNSMHISIVGPLLRDTFDYTATGLINRNSIHFFTLNKILKLAKNCGFTIETIWGETNNAVISDADNTLLENLQTLPDIASADNFKAYNYILSLSCV